jgi:catechol 2,3-dioxygenase-like lactoylglutathione lyase family enzyme
MDEQTDRDERPRITQVGMVGVPVIDQERALEFYVDRLHFEKRIDVTFDGGRWLEVAPPGATTTIALVRRTEGMPIGIETGIRLTTEDAAAVHSDLRVNGVDADPEVLRMRGVPPMFSFRDPDGNGLRIVERHRV